VRQLRWTIWTDAFSRAAATLVWRRAPGDAAHGLPKSSWERSWDIGGLIASFRAALSSTSSEDDGQRSYALVWLLHLLGDVHQPLHATSRFSRALGGTDNGGNEVKIDCSPRASCLEAHELHAFWDDLLGPNNTQPATVVNAVSTLPIADEALAAIPDEKVWIEESFTLAKSDVYKSPPIGTTKDPSTITQAYKDNAERIAKERISLAGARLAKLLNDAFR
jgi:S1/P1 Nuclease